MCIAMPQKFASERLYINTILKLSYYFHALSRFDKPAEERAKSNLIVLSADEGQEILTPRIRLLPESTASSGASARF